MPLTVMKGAPKTRVQLEQRITEGLTVMSRLDDLLGHIVKLEDAESEYKLYRDQFYHGRRALQAQLELTAPLWVSLGRVPALELASMLWDAFRMQKNWLYDLMKKLEFKTGGRDGIDVVDWQIDREYKLAFGAVTAMVVHVSDSRDIYDRGPMIEFVRAEGEEPAYAEETRKGEAEKAIRVVDFEKWEGKQKASA